MEIQKLLQIRREKGREIARTSKVVLSGYKWLVPSQSSNKTYEVVLGLGNSRCNCPDFIERGLRCKHIFAVEITISKQINEDGTTTLTTTKRITYSQNWKAYNTAQINEQDLFMKLLADLCKDIEEPLYKFGRPRLQLKDMVFSSALKVYSTFSLRRFMGDTKTAVERGYLSRQSSFTAVGKYIQNKKLTPILRQLITISAIPLRSVETKFAIDSTGFRTTKFNDYCREKHQTHKEHKWIKAHLCCGVKTNIITSVQIGDEDSADSPQFIPLAQETHQNGFRINEMTADKAYSSRDNLAYINSIGGMPYIPFKSNATGKPKGNDHIWRLMYDFFTFRREEFMEHYHNRSNIESTNNMIKAKFTDLVRSKDETAQKNEVLLKVLCHNIVVLIQEMHELGIKPDFYMGV